MYIVITKRFPRRSVVREADCLSWDCRRTRPHHHPFPTKVVGTFMEISSRTPRMTIAEIRSLVSSPEFLTITSGYVAHMNALQSRRLFRYLPNSNDQQTGDAFAWVSKVKVLVSHRSFQAWHGLSSRSFVLFSERLYSKHAIPYLISIHFNSSGDLQYTFALWFTSTAFTMENCFKQ